MPRYHGFTEQQYQDILTRHAAKAGGSPQGTSTRPVTADAPSIPSPYKSKWEASYAGKLDLEQRAGIITQWWYEPFSLWLPGKIRYKPDFLVEYQPDVDDHVCYTPLSIIEVKGWSQNKRDGMTRLKIAAALFPCFRWVLASHTKHGWEEVAP